MVTTPSIWMGLREKLRLKQGDIFNRTFLTQDVEGLSGITRIAVSSWRT